LRAGISFVSGSHVTDLMEGNKVLWGEFTNCALQPVHQWSALGKIRGAGTHPRWRGGGEEGGGKGQGGKGWDQCEN